MVRVWGLQTGECERLVQGEAELEKYARAPFADGLAPFVVDGEFCVMHTKANKCVARAPGNWHHLRSHPDFGAWAAANHTHLTAWRLERIDAEIAVEMVPWGERDEAEKRPPALSRPVSAIRWRVNWRKLWRWFG
jgi:hypothetical protein